MRRLILVVALFVAFASSARAQTVEATFDLNEFGMGVMDIPTPIDADGDSATQEWLFRTSQPIRFAVAVERSGWLCFEDWFQIPDLSAFSRITIAERHGRSKILVKHVSFAQDQPFMVVSLNIARCR